jgi:hypothetical protein
MKRFRTDYIWEMLASILFSLSPSCLLFKNVKVNICKNILLLVVLYGCRTWSPTLWEEHRLRVFENWVLRRILGPEVTREWRKLHNKEIRNLYPSSLS